ncbi:MAG: helix-turn-helix transcriptional regulator [Rhodospirillaceae bacterium]|nr:helix-turn-helix transcriptional regulator [Rhodospirillaceae bacterium]
MDIDDKGLTREQCRAARALLDWSQADLALKTGLSEGTVRFFESGLRTPSGNSRSKLRSAMESAGVEFIPENGGGAGVRLKKRGKRSK